MLPFNRRKVNIPEEMRRDKKGRENKYKLSVKSESWSKYIVNRDAQLTIKAIKHKQLF